VCITLEERRKNVLRDVVNEMLHGVNATVRWFGSRFPDEEILSALPASYAESSQGRRLGWGRRGVVIFTRQQVLACFAAYARTEDIFFLIIGILAVASTFNRLPHQRQIWLGEIESVEVGSVGGFTLRGIRESHTLSINTLGHKVQYTSKEDLTDEVKQILEIPNQAINNHTHPS
jgi:hypothetical protein